MVELVTLPDAAERLHVPAHVLAREVHRTHLPAGGVADDGRALLFSLARVRALVPTQPERTDA